MKRISSLSLSALLRVWVIGSALLIVLCVGVILMRTTQTQGVERLEFIRKTAQLYVDDSISIELGRGNLVYVADGIRRLKEALGAERIRVRDISESVIESTDPSEIGQSSRRAESSYGISLSVFEHSSRERLGEIQIEVSEKKLWGDSLRAALEPTIFTLLVLLIFALGGSWFLRSRIISPIRALLPSGGSAAPQDESLWPEEFRDLKTRLDEAIKRRDLAVIGQLASGVIHDIKTLLHPIGTAADLVAEQPELTEKRERRVSSLLKAIGTNIPRINQLVEQTLDGSRSISIRAQNSDLVVSIAHAIEVNRSLADGCLVSVDFMGPSSLICSLDPVQFERALVNLIKNGIEAARESSNSPRLVRISLVGGDKDAPQILVEDSGDGFSQSGSEIFTPLRSTKPHGSGLGLLIVRKIVEAHAGEVSAEPRGALGGARFMIRMNAGSANVQKGQS